jgi:hypothetical protein
MRELTLYEMDVVSGGRGVGCIGGGGSTTTTTTTTTRNADGSSTTTTTSRTATNRIDACVIKVR